MKTPLLALVAAASIGCGTLINGGPATMYPPPGGMIDGVPGPIPVSKSMAHEVTYPNGQRCLIEPTLGVGYVVVDVVLLFLVGLIVDAVTGDWHVLDPSMCPGVMIN